MSTLDLQVTATLWVRYHDSTMLQRLLILIVPIVAGVATGSQGPINAELARYVGPIRASLVSVTVSLLTLSLVIAVNRGGGNLTLAAGAPRWSLVGGMLGVVVLTGTVVSVPRLGTAATAALLLAGQLTAAAVIDHFGWLGVTQRPIDSMRLLGLVLLAAGGTLVVWR